MAGESQARIGIYGDDKASPTIKSVQGSLQHLAKDAKSSILTGIGLGAGVTAFNLVAGAIRGTVGALGDAIQSARDDRVSVAQLTAALDANIAGWDGNTGAIEQTIAARMRLGFTDEEQRASLAALVAMTKDSTAALDINRVAMDLARLKGIDLGTASTVLGKAFNGNVTALQRMGIQVDKGARGMEVLGLVQSRVAGQAAAFARADPFTALGIAVEELGEKAGSLLVGPLTELANFALDELIPAIEDIGTTVGDTMATLDKSTGDINAFLDSVSAGLLGMSAAEFDQMKTNEEYAASLAAAFDAARPATKQAVGQTEQVVVDGFGQVVEATARLPREMADAMLANQQELADAAQQLVDFMADALSPAQVVARDVGFLSSSELATGLASGKPLVRQKAREMRDAALVEIGSTAGVYEGGAAISATWIKGIVAAMRAGKIDVATAINQIKRLMGGSLPTEGPLKGDTAERGGRSIAEAWGAALVGGIAETRGNLMRAMPVLSAGSAASAVAPSGGGSGALPPIQIFLDGRELSESNARWGYYASPGGPARLPR